MTVDHSDEEEEDEEEDDAGSAGAGDADVRAGLRGGGGGGEDEDDSDDSEEEEEDEGSAGESGSEAGEGALEEEGVNDASEEAGARGRGGGGGGGGDGEDPVVGKKRKRVSFVPDSAADLPRARPLEARHILTPRDFERIAALQVRRRAWCDVCICRLQHGPVPKRIRRRGGASDDGSTTMTAASRGLVLPKVPRARARVCVCVGGAYDVPRRRVS